MSDPSEYERLQIESLRGRAQRAIEPASGLFLMTERPLSQFVFETAVRPAFRANDLNPHGSIVWFESHSLLREVCDGIRRAEIIVADVTDWGSDVTYVLGLCHGMDRCPLLIGRRPVDIPFGLDALRTLEYDDTKDGMIRLSDQITRAVRVFLTASRSRPGAETPPPGEPQ